MGLHILQMQNQAPGTAPAMHAVLVGVKQTWVILPGSLRGFFFISSSTLTVTECWRTCWVQEEEAISYLCFPEDSVLISFTHLGNLFQWPSDQISVTKFQCLVHSRSFAVYQEEEMWPPAALSTKSGIFVNMAFTVKICSFSQMANLGNSSVPKVLWA